VENSDLKQKTDMHWARKIWHMGGVSAIAAGAYVLPPFWAGFGLIALWVAYVPLDFLRLKFPALNDLISHVFKPVMRRHERSSLAGTTYLLSGVLLTYLVFPRSIFFLTLLYLAFADPFASVFGIKFGKDKIFGHKSLQGSLAAFLICGTITFAFLYYNSLFLDRLFIVSLLGGLVGALAEAVPIGKMDDNFSIPVISAAGLYILFSVFGGFSTLVNP
jgi:dolichol kinase